MKVGILTYHNAINYGGLLQSYALQQVLNSIDGIEAEDIDYRSPAVEQQYCRLRFKDRKSLKQYVLLNATTYARKGKKKNFERFLAKHMTLSPYVDRFSDNVAARYDAIVVGSDQVWNPLCTDGDDTYLLGFTTEKTKKIAYAVSMGNADKLDMFFSRYNVDYKAELSKFYAISTREADAGSYLSKLLGKECVTVVDPVFLYGRENWEKFVKKTKQPYILVYNIGNFSALFSFTRNLEKETGLQILAINKDVKGDMVLRGTKKCSNVGPEEFVSLIYNATYIVTDSFHATAFSIMFHKKFFTIGNVNAENTNSRLVNVLDFYGLHRSYITDGKLPDCLAEEIDYTGIERKMKIERTESIKWLKAVLDV